MSFCPLGLRGNKGENGEPGLDGREGLPGEPGNLTVKTITLTLELIII